MYVTACKRQVHRRTDQHPAFEAAGCTCRSSTGIWWHQTALAAQLKLHARAYLHKFESAGCEVQTIKDAADHMLCTSAAYQSWFTAT